MRRILTVLSRRVAANIDCYLRFGVLRGAVGSSAKLAAGLNDPSASAGEAQLTVTPFCAVAIAFATTSAC
jgi:uncharacterized transporter YbjL